jgi:hypothetical protein
MLSCWSPPSEASVLRTGDEFDGILMRSNLINNLLR